MTTQSITQSLMDRPDILLHLCKQYNVNLSGINCFSDDNTYNAKDLYDAAQYLANIIIKL